MTAKLGPADAKEAYQSQVPRMRREFARQLVEIKRACERDGTLWKPGGYLDQVVQAAEDEMIRRNKTAASCVMTILESGWTPSAMETVDSVFVDCFNNFDGMERDSFSDLQRCFDQACQGIGNSPNQKASDDFGRRLGAVQVAAAKESTATLKVYRMKSSGHQFNITGHTPVVQVGDGNIASVSQTFGPDVLELVKALRALREEAAGMVNGQVLADLTGSAEEEIGRSGVVTSKVKSMLVAVAQTVQTIGAIPSSYPLLTAAAHAVGITLPSLPN